MLCDKESNFIIYLSNSSLVKTKENVYDIIESDFSEIKGSIHLLLQSMGENFQGASKIHK
jgi:hypothetical protein